MSRRRTVLLLTLLLVASACAVAFLASATSAGAASSQGCGSGSTEYKVEGNPLSGLAVGQSKTVVTGGQSFTFTRVVGPAPFTNDTFSFASTIWVRTVLVKGGPDVNTYVFSPAVMTATGLHPTQTKSGRGPDVSFVSFCLGADPGTTTSSSTTTTLETTFTF